MEEPVSPFDRLSPFDESGELINVIIDTPKGSRNKYKYVPETGLFKLGGILTVGHSFPYDFGFIPHTLGGDGDPLDVLVLTDEPGFVGLWVECRLIGAFKADQTERDGTVERNDRLVAVAEDSLVYNELRSLDDLNSTLADQMVHFFVSYNNAKGKRFQETGRLNAKAALELVRRSEN